MSTSAIATSTSSRRKNSKRKKNNVTSMSEASDIDDTKKSRSTSSRGRHVAPTAEYPISLAVDFTSLSQNALDRLCRYYEIDSTDDVATTAATVATQFFETLDTNEEDSIVSFMQRLRNGTISGNSRSRLRKKKKKPRKKGAKKVHLDSLSNEEELEFEDDDDMMEEETENATKVYCICNKPSYGDMIACDGNRCPNPSQWYHLDCVGLTPGSHPDIWLCPDCAKGKKK